MPLDLPDTSFPSPKIKLIKTIPPGLSAVYILCRQVLVSSGLRCTKTAFAYTPSSGWSSGGISSFFASKRHGENHFSRKTVQKLSVKSLGITVNHCF